MGERILFLGGLFMNKKFFTIGMAVILGASLSFFACEDKPEEAADPTPAELAAELAENADFAGKVTVEGATVTLKDDVSITADITVPAGVTLDAGAYTLTVESKTLSVAGALAVAGSGSIALTDAASVVKFTADAAIKVGANNNVTATSGTSLTSAATGATLTADANANKLTLDGGLTVAGGTIAVEKDASFGLVTPEGGTGPVLNLSNATLQAKSGSTLATAEVDAVTGAPTTANGAINMIDANATVQMDAGSKVDFGWGNPYVSPAAGGALKWDTGSTGSLTFKPSGVTDITGQLSIEEAESGVATDNFVNVKEGGKITVGNGKHYKIGGTLKVESGGEVVVQDGGILGVQGSTEKASPTKAYGTIETAGTGKITAGGTEFGGTGQWDANLTGHSNTGIGLITIKPVAGSGTTIAFEQTSSNATAGTLTADGTPAITQNSGANNAFTIGANTTIALGGDGAAVGSIVLKGDVSNPGKLAFTNAGSSDVGTSLVTTGATSADNKVTGTVSSPATGGTNVVWYAANATTGGKWSKVGVSNTSGVITGGGADADVTLSGATTVTAASVG
jgi:hypothetical protein